MQCPFCHADAKPGAKFCPACGTNLLNLASGGMVCRCGTLNPAGSTKCSNCASPIGESRTPAPAPLRISQPSAQQPAPEPIQQPPSTPPSPSIQSWQDTAPASAQPNESSIASKHGEGSRSSNMIVIMAVITLVALGGIGGLWYWFSSAPMREFETQIGRNNLISGTYSAYTVYQRTLGEKGPTASMVKSMGEKAYPLLEQKSAAFLETWYRESEIEELTWEDYARIREWMNIIKPSSENRAHQEYAQGMFLITSKNQIPEGRVHLEQALSLAPNWNLALNGLGRVYKNLKDYPTARSYYERAFAADRTWCFPAFNLGNLFRDNLKDYAVAESFYKEAIQINPDRPSFHWQLATLYYIQGTAFYPQACEAYRRSLQPPPSGKKGLSPEAEAQARDRIARCCGN